MSNLVGNSEYQFLALWLIYNNVIHYIYCNGFCLYCHHLIFAIIKAKKFCNSVNAFENHSFKSRFQKASKAKLDYKKLY